MRWDSGTRRPHLYPHIPLSRRESDALVRSAAGSIQMLHGPEQARPLASLLFLSGLALMTILALMGGGL